MEIDTRELATKIVQELGNEWSLEDKNHYNEHITNKEGMGLYLHIESYGAKKDRLEIGLTLSYELNQQLGYNQHRPSITVDSKRPVAAITKEITTRLLPQATALYHTLVERLNEHNAYENRKMELCRTLTEALGLEFKPDNRDRTDHLHAYLAKRISVDIECSDGEVTMKLSWVPTNTAKAICEILRQSVNKEG